MIEYQIYVRASLIDNTPICLFRVVLITFSYSLDENVVTDRLSGKKKKLEQIDNSFLKALFSIYLSDINSDLPCLRVLTCSRTSK
jgi:hypothetical protein